MPFISPYANVKVQLLNDRERYPWITLDQLMYECPLTGETFIVPKHFRTDGASVPKALVLLPVVGPTLFQRFFGQGVWKGFREGVLHDWLRTPHNGLYPVPADVAHALFKRALQDSGYPDDLVNAYYEAVKAFNS